MKTLFDPQVSSDEVTILIFHHSGADGYIGAASIAYWFHKRRGGVKIHTVPINYGPPLPVEWLAQAYEDPNMLVFMVDFTAEDPMEMRRLFKRLGNRFVWIDHHKANYARVLKHSARSAKRSTCILDETASGSDLAWVYMMHCIEKGVEYEEGYALSRRDTLPLSVAHAARRDLWQFKFGDDTHCWHLGYTAQGYESAMHSDLLYLAVNELPEISTDYGDDLIKDGRSIYRYLLTILESIARTAFRIKLEKHKAYACPCPPLLASDLAEYMRREGYDCDFFVFFYDTRVKGVRYRRVMQLRANTDVVNLALLAQKFGGGGHTAAGFRVEYSGRAPSWEGLTPVGVKKSKRKA